MLLSPRKNGLTSLFKEVRVFKDFDGGGDGKYRRGPVAKGSCISQEAGEKAALVPEVPCWKGFPARKFDAAGKLFPDFPAARNDSPAKVWALSGKENFGLAPLQKLLGIFVV